MFTPQTDELVNVLHSVAGIDALLDSNVFPDLSDDLISAILEEAGRFATDVIAPLNREGDIHGCRLDTDTHDVTTAPGWKEAYAQWAEAGWPAVPCDPEHGGQGLPTLVALAVQELWNTAASAYGIGSLLTQGAVDAIAVHGSDDLKQRYLPHMVSGRWTGTMNLTESQAGSDLAAIKARAEPAGAGSYRITGTKIFITYGEHDLTDNIIHLVLARLPDAPPGTRGISLFLVPKFLLDDNGEPATRNDVKCIGLEHKMGIHGSPTCTLRFGDEGGAVGWLVGEENRGLNCMFTMMNNARLHVGMQGVAVAERATQQATAYAAERRQGRKHGHDGMVAIIEHADVRRMLLDMRSRTAAARAVCFQCARALDLAHHAPDEATRAANEALAALLTPVAKAFGTDMGLEVASTGIQVHGGMGFIEETGAAQHLRDVRITQIYEGTNGIQALDLVSRKLPLASGKVVEGYIAWLRQCAERCAGGELADTGDALARAIDDLEASTRWLLARLADTDEAAAAAATPYLRLFGLVAGSAGQVLQALDALGDNAPASRLRIAVARYFAANHLPETSALARIVCEGTGSLLSVDPALLTPA